ncbi:MAG: hypothetical protein JWL70_1437 [Acidimicrobiia bacterium]|nr:hypothetical protein [Acidimicrobiia bacterium]
MNLQPLSRRHFLELAGAGAAAALLAGCDSRGGSAKPAPTSTAVGGASAAAGVLVLVTLYGGNDGLNTVVPAQDAAYLGGRGALAIPGDQVLGLGEGLGLHPALTGLKQRWDAKQLAVIRGVGYPNPVRSHFRSMDIWQTGVPDRLEPSGWLGRWLDTVPANPLSAVAIGTSVPLALRGTKSTGSAVPAGLLRLPAGPTLAGSVATLADVGSRSPLAAMVARSNGDLLTLQKSLAVVPAAPAPKADNELAAQLDFVARAIVANVPTKVWAVSLGGFDTHASEKATHDRLMGDLDAALTAFAQAIGDRPVTTLVYSEFGRRVAANASDGTDHGTAAPVLVMGRNVRGGFYGEQPSLTNLDDGDLKFTTDYRQVYASVLASVLEADPKGIIGGKFAPLPFI